MDKYKHRKVQNWKGESVNCKATKGGGHPFAYGQIVKTEIILLLFFTLGAKPKRQI